MSTVLDMQVYSLLARLNAEREEGCRRITSEARDEAADLVVEARRRARSQVKAAVVEKRRRVAEHCRRVRTEVEARQRERYFSELGARLAEALEALPQALGRRWQEPDARRRWCESTVGAAQEVLSAGHWQVSVAPGLSAAEREWLVDYAARAAGGTAEVTEDPSLGAGIVVSEARSRCDGSIAGLTADRSRVESALLAELDRDSEAAS